MQQAHAAGARLKRAHAACACDGRAIEAPDMNTYAMVGQTEGKRENMEERKARPTLGRMVAVGVLVVAVLAAATTWARYASEVSGADTVDVATFKVSASGFEEGKDVELFTTVYELDDTTDFTAGVEEKDVAAGKVAPGTWGKFEMTLQNDSDVTVTYEVKLAYNDTAVPLEFSFDATTWKAASAVGDLEGAKGELAAPGADGASVTATKTVYWKWPYQTGTTDEEKEAADKTDTDLGTGTATPKATDSVDFAQKN